MICSSHRPVNSTFLTTLGVPTLPKQAASEFFNGWRILQPTESHSFEGSIWSLTPRNRKHSNLTRLKAVNAAEANANFLPFCVEKCGLSEEKKATTKGGHHGHTWIVDLVRNMSVTDK